MSVPYSPKRLIGRLDRSLLLGFRTRGHVGPVERLAKGLGAFGEYGSGWAALGLGGAALTPARHDVRVVHQQLEAVDLETDADLVALSFFSGLGVDPPSAHPRGLALCKGKQWGSTMPAGKNEVCA